MPNRLVRFRLIGAAFALLSTLIAGPIRAQTAQDTTAARLAGDAATTWLALVDHGQHEQSWDAAAPALQHAITKAGWSQALHQVRGSLDPFSDRTLLKSQYTETLPNAPPGPYVVIQYRTKAKGAVEVIETVTPMRLPDGSWRVSGYYVRPAS